jgi:hypothetical protein
MSYKTYTYNTGKKPIVIPWNLNEYKEYHARLDSMQQWCDENFEHWGFSAIGNGFHEFWFAGEKDLTLFLLRWS